MFRSVIHQLQIRSSNSMLSIILISTMIMTGSGLYRGPVPKTLMTWPSTPSLPVLHIIGGLRRTQFPDNKTLEDVLNKKDLKAIVQRLEEDIKKFENGKEKDDYQFPMIYYLVFICMFISLSFLFEIFLSVENRNKI